MKQFRKGIKFHFLIKERTKDDIVVKKLKKCLVQRHLLLTPYK